MWRDAKKHSQLIQVISRLRLAWMLPSCTSMGPYSFHPPDIPRSLALTARGPQASLHTPFLDVRQRYTQSCHFCYRETRVSLSYITDIIKDRSLIKSVSLIHKSHLEITLTYHIQVRKEKANVILMNSEFIQPLNLRIEILAWTFS